MVLNTTLETLPGLRHFFRGHRRLSNRSGCGSRGLYQPAFESQPCLPLGAPDPRSSLLSEPQ